MQVQPVKNSNSTTFGNVIATERALKYLDNNLNPKQIKKVNQIFSEQENKKPDIILKAGTYIHSFLNHHTEHEFLRAEVGQKHWSDNMFLSPFGVIKKAVRYAENFDGELKINRDVVKTKQ